MKCLDCRVPRAHNRSSIIRVRILHPLHGHPGLLPVALPHFVFPGELPQPTLHSLRLRTQWPQLRRHLLPLPQTGTVPQRNGNHRHQRRQQPRPHRRHWCPHALTDGQRSLVQTQPKMKSLSICPFFVGAYHLHLENKLMQKLHFWNAKDLSESGFQESGPKVQFNWLWVVIDLKNLWPSVGSVLPNVGEYFENVSSGKKLVVTWA